MMRFLLYICSFLMVLVSANTLSATHNRAGEITYEQTGELSIRMTITTYTKTSSTAADRDSLEVFWGDGSSEYVVRSNGNGFPLPNDIKINYYIAEHTYPGRGTYTISMMDPNRVSNILNVNWPNSVNIPFFIETTFTLLNTQFQGFNNSAILLQPPIDFACAGQRFVHNPNAFDPDGDSLSYALIVPLQSKGLAVPDYEYPNQIAPGEKNNIQIDPRTGSFIWDVPQLLGEYNIAIRINEYREGVLINSLIRDMQIFVRPCENTPPTINSIDEICVVAGDTVIFDIDVNDMDEGQLVALSASGGPFTFDMNPSRLEVVEGYSEAPLKGKFIWTPNCDQISPQYYQIVFRGVDNFDDTTGLADLKTVKIKVVGPPPLDIRAESNEGQIKVSWELPYDCEFTSSEYFQGFSVWRRIGSNQFPPDTCRPGLEGRSYEKIVFLTNENDGSRYFAMDASVEKGITYCYRVLAEFAQSTILGNPFNKVQSLPSDEVCLQVSRDLPLMTMASITATSLSEGEVALEWTKPLAEELDTLENPGPYRYRLMRATGITGTDFISVPGADFTIDQFTDPVDTFFVDRNLNTSVNGYNYKVEFYSRDLGNPLGASVSASTPFLSVVSSDQRNILSWAFNVPWINRSYVVFRYNDQTATYDSIATVGSPDFVDLGLENGQEYCYKITTIGTYGIQGIRDPLFNDSQIICATPVDTVAPCPPELSVINICDDINENTQIQDFINFLNCDLSEADCGSVEDLLGFRIYYSNVTDGELEFLEEIIDPEIGMYEHIRDRDISGCYAVSSIDSSLNESQLSNIICVDNCPVYELPNAFTPNGDGANDLFTPILDRFINSIDLSVFNRWGQKVFETNDPKINWDGRNLSGSDLAEGVYFYSCKIFEQRVEGILESNEVLTGYIHIIRGD